MDAAPSIDNACNPRLPALTEIKLIDYDREKAAADKKRLIDRWLSEVAGS